MRYYIRQHKKFVSGPHEIEHIKAWIREGKVREEMEFSTDGEEWMLGIEVPSLFLRLRRRKHRRTRAH